MKSMQPSPALAVTLILPFLFHLFPLLFLVRSFKANPRHHIILPLNTSDEDLKNISTPNKFNTVLILYNSQPTFSFL